MKKLIFVLCSTVCIAQTNQYTKVLLSKKTGKEVSSYSDGFGIAYDPVSKKQGIVDAKGNITFESSYKGGISHIFKNRFILYSEEGNIRKSTIIDEKGNELLPFENQDFNTPWWSKERIIASRQGKEAVYDFSGKLIIPDSDKVRFAGKDAFFVLKGKKWFLYDFSGKLLSDREFKDDYSFENGRALIINEENQSEIIGKIGQTLHKFSKNVVDMNAYPYLITQNKASGKYGLIDTEENVIADEIYSDITPEYFGQKEYIYLRKSNKTTVFYKNDQKLYPNNFKYLYTLSNHFFRVYSDKSEQSGIVDLQGNMVVPQEYDFIKNFTISGKDFIYLKKGDEEKLLDKELKNILNGGDQIVGFYPDIIIIKRKDQYYQFSVIHQSVAELKNVKLVKKQNVEYFTILNEYSKPLVCMNNDNLYGILDAKGMVIVPFAYEDIIAFENFENEIVVKKEGKYGVLNFQNEPLSEIIYDKYVWMKEVLKLNKDKKTDLLYFTRFRNETPEL
ncbi:WG repeat-containing protein [Chryseobacterium indologenes]|uniref:WG repeat-containing protein n=1 Tax=Chryseobacterium indologenes TaxID=253 RepID=UPI0025765572|nr:WG repeat-containing protein [Chryseobacterium indologenes]MDM1553981.1 WG repeat-containing protein [Chryseobacterium indologenes]